MALWLLIWETAFKLSGADEWIFPRPGAVFSALGTDSLKAVSELWSQGPAAFWAGAANNSFIGALTRSLYRLVQGYGIALSLGIFLGLLLAYTRFFSWLLGPLILGIQSLPSICWAPVAIIVFGLRPSAILFVVVMGSLGSIAMATADGLRQVPTTYQRVAGTFGAGFFQRLLWVAIPAATPTFITGLKQGWSFAWRSLLAGEMIVSTEILGIGGLLDQSRQLSDYDRVAAVMIVLVCVSVLVDRFIFARMEARVQRRWGLAHGK